MLLFANKTSGMLSLNYADVSPTLQSSSFYQALEEGCADSFEVPTTCYKTDYTLRTQDDVTHLIETIRFWGIEGVPRELIAYALADSKCKCRSIFEEAGRDLPYLKVLSEMQSQPKSNHMHIAMRSGELEIVRYLFENKYCWCENSMEFAAANGRLECMKFAHENGCAWNEKTFIVAAGNGHLDCFQYAVEKGCPRDTYKVIRALNDPFIFLSSANIHELGAFAMAAYKGQQKGLQYMHEHRSCLWNEHTCTAAAFSGHLDCLRYAHENGCSWNADATTLAAQKGHMDCLIYALEQGCPYRCYIIYCMFLADHPDTGKWLWHASYVNSDSPMIVAFNLLLIVQAHVLCQIVFFLLVVGLAYGILSAFFYVVGLGLGLMVYFGTQLFLLMVYAVSWCW